MEKLNIYLWDNLEDLCRYPITFHSLLKALAQVEEWKKTKKGFIVGIAKICNSDHAQWFDFCTMEFKDENETNYRFMLYGKLDGLSKDTKDQIMRMKSVRNTVWEHDGDEL